MNKKKMTQSAPELAARELMMEFAHLTGLVSARIPARRYLWTDAFAVCNFLGLYQEFHDHEYMRLAVHLVDQVHHVLGRHRPDDQRTGWISGLDEQAGRRHPTLGGLRIGKEMNERRSEGPYDGHIEWDRDGQYYHYLTKWMHALNQVSRVTGEKIYIGWAVELAKSIHARFTYRARPDEKRMYWKMSIDLSRPLVTSMGHHDPLDGLITYLQLQASGHEYKLPAKLDLTAEIADMIGICAGKDWATEDPLGIGELLTAAYKLAQLTRNGQDEINILKAILDSARISLMAHGSAMLSKLPARHRLAFRELGLSIGLHAVRRMADLFTALPPTAPARLFLPAAEALASHTPLSGKIESFWLDPANRHTDSWMANRDINMVMLAASLAPDGYLSIK